MDASTRRKREKLIQLIAFIIHTRHWRRRKMEDISRKEEEL
jgi:hypothetical protein